MSDVLLEPPHISREQIEEIVGTKVKNLDLYYTAFTHKSALKQYSLKSSYETLEFLGDAVLSFVITKHLFDTYSEEQEGFLTKVRTKIVRGKTLHEISSDIGLDKFILMDDKGMRNEWFKNPKILEDVFEALIGAIYLDLGIIHVKQFITKYILSRPLDLDDDNYKDIIMRWCQANKMNLPVYQVDCYKNMVFRVSLFVNGRYMTTGDGKTKKAAEQEAARELVKKMGPLLVNEFNCSASYFENVCGTEISGVV